MKMKFILMASSLCMVGATAYAEETAKHQFYAGLAFAHNDHEFRDFPSEGSDTAFSGFAGVRINQPSFFYGFELEYQPGQEVGVAGFTQDGEQLRFKVQAGKDFGVVKAYGVIGAVRQDFQSDVNGNDGHGTGITFGLGAEYDISNHFAVRVEALVDSGTIFDAPLVGGDYGFTNTRVALGGIYKF